MVTSSEGKHLQFGKFEEMLSRESISVKCHTKDIKNHGSRLIWDCSLFQLLLRFSMLEDMDDALRNWMFQMSKDGLNWITLLAHTVYKTQTEPGSTYEGRYTRLHFYSTKW